MPPPHPLIPRGVENARAIGKVPQDRIHPRGLPRQASSGPIAKGWQARESGTYLKFTDSGAEIFA
jgi:hypothetical protein